MSERSDRPAIGARGVSFESRIAIASLTTSIAVLAVASVMFIFVQWRTEIREIKRAEWALSQVVAAEFAPAVARGDAAMAQAEMAALPRFPALLDARIIDAGGRVVVERRVPPPWPAGADHRGAGYRTALVVNGRTVGQLVVVLRPVTLGAILPRYLAVCGALFFAATGLALLMGRWLAGRVVEPVNRLSQVMRDVAESADYAQRAPLWAQDEFGQLTDSFNNLLAQLQTNDRALHRAMSELVDARDAAQAANVLKSQFLANMSHEIRTPLNGVLAMAQIIEMGELSDVQRGQIAVIRRSGEDLLTIITDVLDLSKIEAGKMEINAGEVDAEQLGQNLRAAFAAAKPGLSYVVEVLPDARGRRRGDPARLGQILNNLVSNALKFTHRGEVRVVIGGVGDDGGEGLSVKVIDTGIGVPADKMPSLFQKFSQADGSNTRRFGGTGLGLAISRELATLMGGKIAVESAEGVGSTFTLTVPAARLAAEAGTPAEGGADARVLQVLAAEDIPTNQLVLRTIMQSFGVELDMVDNGRLVVDAWRRGGYDLILMDIQMPEMDGLAATRAIREAERQAGLARTPIIAVSANAMSHQVREYLAAGMDGHVAKPIEMAKLAAAIDAALSITRGHLVAG
jgi:signal transduction histidine kinase